MRNGRFSAYTLEPGGPYTVTVSGSGVISQQREQIYLTLGRPIELNFVLSAAAVELDTLQVLAPARALPLAGPGTTLFHVPERARTRVRAVSFGNGERVEEYDASSNVVWRVEHPGYVFRAQRIRSLYDPGADLTR